MAMDEHTVLVVIDELSGEVKVNGRNVSRSGDYVDGSRRLVVIVIDIVPLCFWQGKITLFF